LSLTCIKINSKWIKELHGSSENLKALEKILGKRLQGVSIGNDFPNKLLESSSEIRIRIDK
jgi:hypothetical protein